MHISFDVVDGCIEKHDRDQYLSLFHPSKKYERMLDRISYLMSQKSNISDVYCHIYMKSGINSVDNLPLEKTLNMQNAIIFIGSSFSNNYNHYRHDVRSTKCELAE